MKTAVAKHRSVRTRRPISRGHSFKLSEAKTYLGRLLEKASAGETVYITRGTERFILQPMPEIDPIPMRPPGYFSHLYTRDVIEEDNFLAKSSVIKAPEDLE